VWPLKTLLKVLVRRHVFDSDRPFSAVLYGIFGGISRPDIEALFRRAGRRVLRTSSSAPSSGRRRAAPA